MSEPVTFALHVEPCPLLEELGNLVELREIAYGPLKRLMRAIPDHDPEALAVAVLGATLHIDGAPVGAAAVDGLPGHLTAEISEVLMRCLELHGLRMQRRAPAATPPPTAVPPDAGAPPGAEAEEEGPSPGEA